jgi:putative inorganic carbon (HCO3(-)) transporter
MRAVILLAAIFLAPFIGGGFGELPNTIILLLTLTAITTQLLLCRKCGDEFPRAPGLRLLLVFLALSCLAGFFTRDIYLTAKQIAMLAGLIGAYALSAAVCRDARVSAAAVWILTVSALLICMIGIRDYAIMTGGGVHFWRSLLSKGTHARLFWPFINPSFLAGFLVLSIPVAMGLYLVTRPRSLAALAGLAAVIQILALMLTGSKFGIISVLFALVVLFVIAAATKSLKHARFRRLVVLAIVLIPLLIVFRGPVTSRIAEAESGGSQVHSTLFRIYTWKSTVGMVRSHPWLGVGPGAFKTVYPLYSLAGPTVHAHNSYLQVAAESGVPAAAALTAALAVLLTVGLVGVMSRRTAPPPVDHTQSQDDEQGRALWKELVPFSGWPMMNCAVFAALVGSAVTNLVDSDWYVIGIAYPFWAMAGVLMAQSGALRDSFRIGSASRMALVAACVMIMAVSISFGLGDLVAPDQMQPNPTASRMVAGYKLASTLNPLNPDYHRELAKWLLTQGDDRDAVRQIDTAVRLSPNDFINHYIMGVIQFRLNDLEAARKSLRAAIRLNPNAIKALMELALVNRAAGDIQGFESALKRITTIETTDYERVKGVPEFVDTSYAYAHAYFGSKYLDARDYRQAIGEYLAGVRRLEDWVSQKDVREMRRAVGALTPEEENELLGLLRTCYSGLAASYQGMGQTHRAAEAREKASKVPTHLD